MYLGDYVGGCPWCFMQEVLMKMAWLLHNRQIKFLGTIKIVREGIAWVFLGLPIA